MKAKVSGKGTDSGYSSFNEEKDEVWGIEEVGKYVREKGRACTLVVIDGWIIDVTGYIKQHVSIFLPNFLSSILIGTAVSPAVRFS
jgi:hypothetical protein